MTHTIKYSGAAASSSVADNAQLLKPAPEHSLPSVVMHQLSSWLDANIQSCRDVSTVCHHGVPAKQVFRFQQEFSWLGKEVLDYIISPSSLAYARSRGIALGAKESGKCVEVMKVVALAQTVFEDSDEIYDWLHTKNWDFQDQSPLQVLKTSGGANVLVDDLLQMEVVCL